MEAKHVDLLMSDNGLYVIIQTKEKRNRRRHVLISNTYLSLKFKKWAVRQLNAHTLRRIADELDAEAMLVADKLTEANRLKNMTEESMP